MASIAEKKQLRDRVLAAVYELTDGNRMESVTPDQLEAHLDAALADVGAEPADIEAAIDWHVGASTLERMTFAGDVSLTMRGLRDAEHIIEDREDSEPVPAPRPSPLPDTPTPAAGAAESRAPEGLAIVTSEQMASLEVLTRRLLQALDSGELVLEHDDEAEVRAHASTIELQRQSGRPRAGVIGWALKGIQFVVGASLEELIGRATWAGIVVLTHLG